MVSENVSETENQAYQRLQIAAKALAVAIVIPSPSRDRSRSPLRRRILPQFLQVQMVQGNVTSDGALRAEAQVTRDRVMRMQPVRSSRIQSQPIIEYRQRAPRPEIQPIPDFDITICPRCNKQLNRIQLSAIRWCHIGHSFFHQKCWPSLRGTCWAHQNEQESHDIWKATKDLLNLTGDLTPQESDEVREAIFYTFHPR